MPSRPIAIELDGTSSVAGERIAARVAGSPTVREVRLAGRPID
ncbi:hypothetical protein HNP52_000084 [Sphingomonas kyeonggiensis]|uniref:Uncharacterized protein n=1 Tax=Sphingomonas kyeonggiensis TaxID=1268553 RepID=A0A7W7NPN9_9SPHN|nr:hypothetical protein [Sphingomonas kyeonggiensis]MBB4837033.1 hypothetical protein [Sphingomonas kyeonggiensis]